MKTSAIYSFLLLSAFVLNGCDGVADMLPADNPQKSVAIEQPVEQSKQSIAEPVKATVAAEKQPIEAKPKVNINRSKKQLAKKTDAVEPTEAPPVLDLEVPFEITEPTEAEATITTNPEPPEYLPDLFTEKDISKEEAVELGGKLIKKEEEEPEKQRAVDGVGINIKLTP